MTIIAKSLIVIGLILGFGTLFAVPAQVNQMSKEGVPVTVYERHVRLEAQQQLETVEVSEACLTFLTEVRFTFTLPLVTSFDIVLPKGSTWTIPSGSYKIDNPTSRPVEFVLKPGACERRLNVKSL
jgi:hypothetical protein